MPSRTRIFHAATALLFGATTLLPRPALPAGDDTPVAALLGACQACHGGDGISEGADVPNLAGQKPNYLVRQLEAFRSGERKSAVMAAIAAQLADADIRALAAALEPAARRAPGGRQSASAHRDPLAHGLSGRLSRRLHGVRNHRDRRRWQLHQALRERPGLALAA